MNSGFGKWAFVLGLLWLGAPAAGAAPLTLYAPAAAPVVVTAAVWAKLPGVTVAVSFMTRHGPLKGRFTGPTLWSLLVATHAIDPTQPRQFDGDTILVTGRDGYGVAVAAGEVAPAFEGKDVILAEQMDGAPLGADHLRLIVPGDKMAGRSVRDVARIAVVGKPAG